MQIVIEISEEIYTHLLARYKYQNIDDIGLCELDKVGVSIKNGTPLHPNSNWTRRHYINGGKTLDMWVCSHCGEEFSYDAETGASIYDYDYCPNCGSYKRNKAEGGE